MEPLLVNLEGKLGGKKTISASGGFDLLDTETQIILLGFGPIIF